jgi:hypothetical protein
MGKPKDQSKKMKVKGRALDRGSEKNNLEFYTTLMKLRYQHSLPKEKRDTDEVIICRIENAEGTGNFRLWSKEGRKYFGGCPGNLVLESMIGQLVKFKIEHIPSQPLVLVLLYEGKALKKPEILCLLSDPDSDVKTERLKLLEAVGVEFIAQDNYEFEKGEDETFHGASDSDVDADDL